MGTGAIILVGTLYKTLQLASGGRAVAESLGGRWVNPESPAADERKLLNVVEEMALASGINVPDVFILEEEDGINAFAAGFTANEAVVAITRGALNRLTRDELQGVVAHEFSHILNGDMRLNIRLMGVLHGILLIALVGYVMMRSAGSGRSSSRKKGNATLYIVLLGLALWLIGYIGVFFAKLIKSAISRQREFLADASAVQFTRNPMGLAGVLRKIAGAAGSQIASPAGEELSHMFFANGLGQSFLNLLATHPPIEERLKRLDPAGADVPAPSAATVDTGSPSAAGFAPPPIPGTPARTGRSVSISLDGFRRQVGTTTPAHLEHISAMLNTLSDVVTSTLRSPAGAQAVIYSLTLSDDTTILTPQLDFIQSHAPSAVTQSVERVRGETARMAHDVRLPVAELSIRALRQMSPADFDSFHSNLLYLISIDNEVSLFEYTLLRMILRQLAPHFGRAKRPVIQYDNTQPILADCAVVLGTMARAGSSDPDAIRQSFRSGMQLLEAGGKLPPTPLPSAEAATLETFDKSLEVLTRASPGIKRFVVDACTACVSCDEVITEEEGELLRAVADSLECPIPPLLYQAPSA
jgi:Zn-dependent protease with chaperone function